MDNSKTNYNYNYYSDVILNANIKRLYDIKCRLVKVIEKMKELDILDKNYKPNFPTKGLYFKPRQN